MQKVFIFGFALVLAPLSRAAATLRLLKRMLGTLLCGALLAYAGSASAITIQAQQLGSDPIEGGGWSIYDVGYAFIVDEWMPNTSVIWDVIGDAVVGVSIFARYDDGTIAIDLSGTPTRSSWLAGPPDNLGYSDATYWAVVNGYSFTATAYGFIRDGAPVEYITPYDRMAAIIEVSKIPLPAGLPLFATALCLLGIRLRSRSTWRSGCHS